MNKIKYQFTDIENATIETVTGNIVHYNEQRQCATLEIDLGIYAKRDYFYKASSIEIRKLPLTNKYTIPDDVEYFTIIGTFHLNNIKILSNE